MNNKYVQLKFSISQHERDTNLIHNFIKFFNCGYITKDNRGGVYYNVTKFSDIFEKIIPVFKENQIIGIKNKDFNN
jgi:hypothetical protein